MIAIRRNKYGKLMYATGVANNHITHLATDPTSAVQLDEPTARAVVDAHKARNNPAAGRIEAVDAKGKVLASAGDPGEPPAPPKPVASLPGLAERVEKLEEQVHLIEAAGDSGGLTPFTNEEVAALKGMLGEWAAHKAKGEQKDDRKEPAKTSTAASGGGLGGKASGAGGSTQAAAPAA